MTKMNRNNSVLKVLALVLCLALVFVNAVAEETAQPAESAEDILCYVNGTPVLRAKADYYYNYMINYYAENYGVDLSANTEAQAELREAAVNSAASLILAVQKCEQDGLSMTEEEMQAVRDDAKDAWDSAVWTIAGQLYGITEESSEQDRADAYAECSLMLEQQSGYTLESLTAEYTESAEYQHAVEAYTADITVGDDKVKEYYDTMVAEEEANFEGNVGMYEYYTRYYGYAAHYTPSGYRGVLQILLEADDSALEAWTTVSEAFASQTEDSENKVTEEDVKAAEAAVIASVQNEIDEVQTRFAAGEAFTDLIREFNTDPGMTDPDTLANGYAVAADSMVWDPAFKNAAMSIESIGGISEPAVGSDGVYIVYYLRDIPAGAAEMTAEEAEEIRSYLLDDARNSAFTELLNGWMQECEIVYTDAGKAYIAPVVEAAEQDGVTGEMSEEDLAALEAAEQDGVTGEAGD